MKKLFILVLLYVISCQLSAQHSVEYDAYKKAYPNAHYVRLNVETKIIIEFVEEELVITREILEEDLYLDAAATYGSKRAITSSSFYQLQDIEASSFFYEKGRYKESKVKDFRKKDELSESFHDDIQSVNFIFPNLRPGSKSKLVYTQKIKDPRFLSAFYFGDFSPIINNKITIIADEDIVLRFKEFNTKGLDIRFKKDKKRGKIIYSWELQDTGKYDIDETYAPSYQSIFPHIIPMITQYKIKDRTVKVSDDISALYNWYYSLVKDINTTENNNELTTLVHSLTADKNSDLEKVKAIYYWVQNNIKYIAFEYALGGFIPREANDVYKKKYGDCKDNSSILSEMLEIAGLKGHLTWIGTRSIPYSYEEVPTPAVDNHMILTWFDGEKPYFLDATGRYIPLESTTSFIQGKEALIAIDSANFRIQKVPVMPARQNALIDSVMLQIEGNSITGTGKAIVSGYQKIKLFNALELEKSEEDIKDLYTWKFAKGNNKFLIDEFSEINKYNYDEDFSVQYAFHIDDYLNQLDDEIYINLNMSKILSGLKVEKDRKNDLEYTHKWSDTYITVLEIPEDYTLTYLPEDINVSSDFFSSTIQYKKVNNKIIYKHTVNINFLTLVLEEQKTFNALIKKIEKQYKEVIILKKQIVEP